MTALNGVSGDEARIKEYIRLAVANISDEVFEDNAGNLYAVKKPGNKDNGLKVMLIAHMDEVGFIVTSITDDGFLKFDCVGGIDERILPGLFVNAGKQAVPGVIGVKPIHLQSESEYNSNVKLEDLFIDIGAKNKKDAEKYIKPGDYVYFDSEYIKFGEKSIKAKALDDRAGCMVLMDMLSQNYDFTLYACFSVQEEIGTRGAYIASNVVKPDIAFIIETTTCADVAEVKPPETSTIYGGGAVISIMDKSSYSDRDLVKYLEDTAVKNNINHQLKTTISGGNDSGALQQGGIGCRTCVISTPCKYIHSPVSCINTDDLECVTRLTKKSLEGLVEFYETSVKKIQ